LAWQLGGKKATRQDPPGSETATNPGDVLGNIIREAAPCLILIDEWVAYARQLMDERKLPGGDFETQFTFAQTLSEQVKAIPGALLVVSIPASTSGDGASPTEGVSDEEVGGSRGREAVARLRNVFQRIASQWRPANAEESYEIVRCECLIRLPKSLRSATWSCERSRIITQTRGRISGLPGADYLRDGCSIRAPSFRALIRTGQDWCDFNGHGVCCD
jgi:hypothetical protein